MESYKNSISCFAIRVCPSVVTAWQLGSWQKDFHETLRLAVLLQFARSVRFCLKFNNKRYIQAYLLVYHITKWKCKNYFSVLKIPNWLLLSYVIYLIFNVPSHFLWMYVHILHYTNTFKKNAESYLWLNCERIIACMTSLRLTKSGAIHGNLFLYSRRIFTKLGLLKYLTTKKFLFIRSSQ
jgi:hypothetical protein